MGHTMKRRIGPLRSMTILTFVAGLFMVAQPNADAITLVPTDLNPGDTYHLVFLTSTTRDATSPVIGDYDSFVQEVADNAGTGIGSSEGFTWRAIVSTPGVATDAVDHVNIMGPVYRLDDTRVADSSADMFDATLDAAINIDETGTTTVAAFTFIWTGSDGFGIGFAGLQLGSGSDARRGEQTPAGITNANWINASSASQTTSHPFYAISESLTVGTPIPEPASILLLGSGLVGLVAWRMKKAKA